MQFKQLQYFTTLVDMHSFTEAAKECFISQSALSQQIKLLEQELNIPLLIRRGRTFDITPAGKLLYSKAKHIAKEMEEIASQVKRVHANLGSTLRLGMLSSMDKEELPQRLKEDLLIRTGLDLEIFYGSHDELYEQFGSGLLNAFISDESRLMPSESYSKKALFNTKLYIEIPKSANLQLDAMDMLLGQNLKGYRSGVDSNKMKIDVKSLTQFKLFFVCEDVHQNEEQRCLNELLGTELQFTAVESIIEGRKQILQYQNQFIQEELKAEQRSTPYNCALIVDRSLLRGDYSSNPKIFRYELTYKGKAQKRRLCCYARNNLDRPILHELCATLLEYNAKQDHYYYSESSLEQDHERAETRRMLSQQELQELATRRQRFRDHGFAI